MQERLLREQEYVNIELPSIIEWCLANTSKAFLPMPHRSWLHWDGLSIFFPQKVIYNFTGNKSLAWNRAAQTYPSLIDSRQGCELFFSGTKLRSYTYWWFSLSERCRRTHGPTQDSAFRRLLSGATERTDMAKRMSDQNNTAESRNPKLSHGEHLTFSDTFQMSVE